MQPTSYLLLSRWVRYAGSPSVVNKSADPLQSGSIIVNDLCRFEWLVVMGSRPSLIGIPEIQFIESIQSPAHMDLKWSARHCRIYCDL